MLELGHDAALTLIWIAGGLTAVGIILRYFTNVGSSIGNSINGWVEDRVEAQLNYTNEGESHRDQLNALTEGQVQLREEFEEHRDQVAEYIGERTTTPVPPEATREQTSG